MLRGRKIKLIEEEIEILNKFILDIINSDFINEKGYYIEDISNVTGENENRTIISYSEPKLIFSLINYYLIKQKHSLNKTDIEEIFFNYFNKIFKKIFINESISQNALSESDIKSLFRTLDNLYDTIIIINNKTSSENKNQLIENDKFIEILDNLSKYLLYITKPSEIIRLVGKRISLIIYHLGKYQTNISFPFIDKIDNITLNDYSSYSYDNYYINENNCLQNTSTFFCMNNNNYYNLINKLSTKYNNLDNLSLNIYLLQENRKENKYDEMIDEREVYVEHERNIKQIIYFKNYSFIFKLNKGNKNENKKRILLQQNDNDKDNNDNILIKYDVEFPFMRNLFEKEQDKIIMDKMTKNYFDYVDLNMTLSPYNKNITCVTKTYLRNNNINYSCITHFDYDNIKVRCSCNTTENDEIFVINNGNLANIFKEIQFPKKIMQKKYILYIIYIFIFILLIPSIYYLFTDILKDSKNINDKSIINLENERKKYYYQVKKYINSGVFLFSFYLSFNKYPYLSVFNEYNNIHYPKYIKHLIICISILLGFYFPLIPFHFISFIERDIFIDQRDIKYDDNFISDIGPFKYYILFFIFGIIGLILSHLFIYSFYIILGYYEDEKNIWFKIKTICKDYIYYEIKSEVLLGSIWNKLKLRMLTYSYICGKYIIKHLKNKNNRFKEYLNHTSRNYNDNISLSSTLNDIDLILPRNTDNTDYRDTLLSKDINNDSKYNLKINEIKSKQSFELAEQNDKNISLLQIDEEENDNILNNNIINNSHYEQKNNNINIDSNNLMECKLDNFILENNIIKYDKSKKKIAFFEKVRNKYIYVPKRNEINEIEIDGDSIDEDKLYISPQINYTYFSVNSFNNLKSRDYKKEYNKEINTFILISSLLWIIFVSLIFLSIFSIYTIEKKFDNFIIKSWLIPLCLIIIVLNFILYYFKILIGTLLLFYFYNKRKKTCFSKFLFSVFVDKAMIHLYKIRNLITKYKKEFDYL